MPLPPPPPSSGQPGTPRPNGPPTTPLNVASAGQATCYRHADRPSGRRCTRCGKTACNECLVQAQVGSHCLDCAKAARPDIATRAKFWSAGQPNLVTMTLIGLNVAIFVVIALLIREPSALTGRTALHFDFAVSKGVLAFDFAPFVFEGTVVDLAPNQWYRLVTSGFLHYGILHIGLNMYFLYILGPMLERPLGRVRFILLYVASLLGGSLGVIVLDSGGLAAGASGAVFGLMAAAAVSLWRRGVNPLSTSIGSTLLLNLFITFVIPGISIGGHLGGAAAGAICATVMLAPGHKPMPRWATYAAPIVVGTASVIVSIMLVQTA